MGLIMKKDDSEDNEYIDGIEVVGRGEGPNGDDEVEHVEIHEGLTAEDISGKTAAAEAERELEARAVGCRGRGRWRRRGCCRRRR